MIKIVFGIDVFWTINFLIYWIFLDLKLVWYFQYIIILLKAKWLNVIDLI